MVMPSLLRVVHQRPLTLVIAFAPHSNRVENKPNQAFFFTAFLDCLREIQLDH